MTSRNNSQADDCENETTRANDEYSDDRYRLLIPVRGDGTTDGLVQSVRTAAAFVRSREQTGELLVGSVITLPEQMSLDQSNVEEQRFREANDTAARLVQVSEEAGSPAGNAVRVAHDEATAVRELAAIKHCNGIFVTTQREHSEQQPTLGKRVAMELDTRAEPDVFVYTLTAEPEAIRRIFLAVGGGPHSALATEAARALALTHDANIDITHIYADETATDLTEATNILQRAETKLSGVDLTETGLLPSEHAAETIVERSQRYDVTVLGSPTMDRLREFVFGTAAGKNQSSGGTNAVLTARQRSEKRP